MMEAAEAAKVRWYERVEVYTIGVETPDRGKVERIDEHGLALALDKNKVLTGRLVYIPWSTVTGVYWLGEENE